MRELYTALEEVGSLPESRDMFSSVKSFISIDSIWDRTISSYSKYTVYGKKCTDFFKEEDGDTDFNRSLVFKMLSPFLYP